jgi:hypothetical protein
MERYNIFKRSVVKIYMYHTLSMNDVKELQLHPHLIIQHSI